MALSSLNKEVATRLLESVCPADHLSSVRRDHAACAKLSLLAEQMEHLRAQAHGVVEDCTRSAHLASIVPSKQTLVVGNVYHWYAQFGREVLSLVGPAEWSTFDAYRGSFVYDADHVFRALPRARVEPGAETTAPTQRQ